MGTVEPFSCSGIIYHNRYTYCIMLSLSQALQLDEAGDVSDLEQIKKTLAAAVAEDPDNLELACRYINHLAFSGRGPGEIDAVIDEIIAASVEDPEQGDRLIVPVADILARTGENSRAYQLLTQIPDQLYSDQAELLKQQLDKSFLVEEDKDVVSWERLGTDWHHQPPIQLPDIYQGRRRAENWIAAKLSAKDADHVYLRVGAVAAGEVGYGSMELEYRHWLEIGGGELADFADFSAIPAGTSAYWEVGSYARLTRVAAAPGKSFSYALPDPVPAPWRFRF